MAKKKYIVTLKDIAAETGMSVPTVSRVLHKKGEFLPETIKTINDAAERLGYHSNLLIQGIQNGKTRTIGVIIPVCDPFFAQIVHGIGNELMGSNYVPLLSWVNGGRERVEEPMRIRQMIEHRVEAIIMVCTTDLADDTYFQQVMERDIPIITVDRQLPLAHLDFFGTDDQACGRLAAEHLLSLGHRQIGQISGPCYTSPARERSKGFSEAVQACPEASLVTVENSQFHENIPLAIELFRQNQTITALFTGNDHIAKGAYQAAREIGLRIPEDISVIGCGNLPFSEFMPPALTTIDQHPKKLGGQIGKHVLTIVEKNKQGSTPLTYLQKPSIISRKSIKRIG